MISNFISKNMNEKKFSTDGFSFYRVLFILFIVFAIGVGIFAIFKNNNYDLFEKLVIKQDNTEGLLNTIWQVQSTVVTLTTILLSIIISLNKSKIYGIEILNFMMVKKTRILTFYEKLILNLILILVEYCFIAYMMVESAVFILFLSTIIITYMVYKSLRCVAFESEIENEIKRYIIEQTNKTIKLENEKNREEAI